MDSGASGCSQSHRTNRWRTQSRFAGKGKGKRAGYRIVTFFSGAEIPVFLLNVFAENEKADLTPNERRILTSVLAEVVQTYRAGKEPK